MSNFGSSTIVIYIEAKQVSTDKWEIFKFSGREKTNINLCNWVDEIQDRGCGEILLTSIDYEGLQRGFDIDMIDKIYAKIKVPLIISGGCGDIDHIISLKNFNNASVALASVLHYNKINIDDIRKKLPKICILDYGLGNIKSLHNALKKIGCDVDFYSEKKMTNMNLFLFLVLVPFRQVQKK